MYSHVLTVSCGNFHTCALILVPTSHFAPPPLPPLPSGSTTTTAGACGGVGRAGTVFAWGMGGRGQLGQGDRETRQVPMYVDLGTVSACMIHAVSVSAGVDLSIATMSNGQVSHPSKNQITLISNFMYNPNMCTRPSPFPPTGVNLSLALPPCPPRAAPPPCGCHESGIARFSFRNAH